MNRKRNILATILTTALIFTILAGCAPTKNSGDSKSGDKKSEIRTVKVVAKTAAQPYQFFDDKNKFTGYNGEILKEISKKLKNKYRFEYYTVDPDAVFVGLQTGKYDVAVGNYYTSEERNKTFEHSNNLTFLSDLRLIVRKNDNSIKSLDDIAGSNKKLAQIDVADPRYNIIEDYNKKHPNKKIALKGTGFENTADVLKSVANGQNDAAIYPLDGYDAVQKEAKLPLKTVQTVGIYPVAYYYHKSDEDKQLRDDIDNVLADLRKDGTLSKLSKKWFNRDPFSLQGADEITNVDFWKK
ncbi:MAG: Amino acid transporter substrate-binding protein family [Sphingobacterium sp.]|jgi:L-cystine transport system substrate-binding protein|nr:Amino acid transporter substrate-binding protein family [Sphingobacterium sp.]